MLICKGKHVRDNVLPGGHYCGVTPDGVIGGKMFLRGQSTFLLEICFCYMVFTVFVNQAKLIWFKQEIC